MKSYDLYSAKEINLDVARDQIEESLGIALEERDSIYQGGVYYRWRNSYSENIVLKNNLDPFDGEAAEHEFPNCLILLYVNATERSYEFFHKLKGNFILLRHEELD